MFDGNFEEYPNLLRDKQVGSVTVFDGNFEEYRSLLRNEMEAKKLLKGGGRIKQTG